MGDIEVTADHDAFLLGQSSHISAEVILPLHPVVQALELILGIGHIDAHEIEFLVFRRYHTSFVVVQVDTHIHRH